MRQSADVRECLLVQGIPVVQVATSKRQRLAAAAASRAPLASIENVQ